MFIIIVVLAALIAILGYYVIKADIMDRAQRKVRDNLKAARSFYQGEIDRIETAFNLVNFDSSIAELYKVAVDILNYESEGCMIEDHEVNILAF